MVKTIKMPDVRFSKRDHALQEREGWAVFESSTRGPEIQRDDCAAVFKFDEDALAHVMRRALAGSKPHIKALVAHCTAREAYLGALLKRGREPGAEDDS